jgi:hypothetical protein
MAKLMKKKQCRVPRVLVTDKLRSYGVAHRELMSSVERRSHKGRNGALRLSALFFMVWPRSRLVQRTAMNVDVDLGRRYPRERSVER